MEGIARLVAESMARHGIKSAVDHRRLQWSPWFRCESSFSLPLLPGKPGLFALGEELVPPGQLSSPKRMLAVLQVSEAAELGVSISRIFAPGFPLQARIKDGRIFARYTVIEDDVQRRAALTPLQRWLATSAESASGIAGDLGDPDSSSLDFVEAVDSDTGNTVRSEELQSPSVFPAGF
jgi:hypothetical protein